MYCKLLFTDNLDKARRKLKKCEITSDITSESEVENKKRTRIKKTPNFLSSSSSGSEEELLLKRPPQLPKIKTTSNVNNFGRYVYFEKFRFTLYLTFLTIK